MAEGKQRESRGGATVFVHGSQFPEAVERELVRSFERREINPKFHYESYKQAAKWLAVHEAHSPARADRDCLATYDRAFRFVAGDVRARRVQVVGLGCGGGQKDVRLLELLRGGEHRATYAPCDVSLPLVLVAQALASKVVPSDAIHPVVCDLAQARDLADVLPKRAGRRVVTFFGMIPNFEPQVVLPRLRALIGRNDRLLFSANLVAEASEAGMRRILPQYDNAETRDWLMTLLQDAGMELADGEAAFSVEQTGGRLPLWRFVARFTFRRNKDLRVAGKWIPFQKGEAMRLFFSYRYTPESLGRWLTSYGIEVVDQWITKSQEEGVFLCRRAS